MHMYMFYQILLVLALYTYHNYAMIIKELLADAKACKDEKQRLEVGDRIYFINKNKSLYVAVIGKEVGRSKKMDWNRKQVLISTIRSCKNWFNYFLRSIIN